MTWDLQVIEMSLQEHVIAQNARYYMYGLVSIYSINPGTLQQSNGKIPGFISQRWKEAANLMQLWKNKCDCGVHAVKLLGD